MEQNEKQFLKDTVQTVIDPKPERTYHMTLCNQTSRVFTYTASHRALTQYYTLHTHRARLNITTCPHVLDR